MQTEGSAIWSWRYLKSLHNKGARFRWTHLSHPFINSLCTLHPSFRVLGKWWRSQWHFSVSYLRRAVLVLRGCCGAVQTPLSTSTSLGWMGWWTLMQKSWPFFDSQFWPVDSGDLFVYRGWQTTQVYIGIKKWAMKYGSLWTDRGFRVFQGMSGGALGFSLPLLIELALLAFWEVFTSTAVRNDTESTHQTSIWRGDPHFPLNFVGRHCKRENKIVTWYG